MHSEPEFVGPLRDFLAREVTPARVKRDDETHTPPTDLLKQLGDLGYLSIGLPPEWDGSGSFMDVLHLMIELGRTHLGLAHLVGRTIYGEQLLLHFGSPNQQERWLPLLRSGSCVLCVGITEPDAGSDAASVSTSAADCGDHYLVNGQKVFSSSMGYADVVLLLVRTSREADRHRGLTTFLMDANLSGIEARRMETLGDWTIGTYETFYTNVRVPPDSVLGNIGDGWQVITSHLARERMLLAARSIGATEALLSETIDHVRNRTQFGRPIGDFQVVRHRLADIHIMLRLARSALFDIASQTNNGKIDPNDAAIIKIFATEMYVNATNIAMQFLGGYGYTRESSAQRHLRDARVYVVGGGSSEVLRDVVARELFRRTVTAG